MSGWVWLAVGFGCVAEDGASNGPPLPGPGSPPVPPGLTDTGGTSASSGWSARYGGAGPQSVVGFEVVAGGHALMGRTIGEVTFGTITLEPEVSGGSELFLARFASDGRPVVARSLGESFGWDLDVDDRGWLWVAGQTTEPVQFGAGAVDAWSVFVAAFDASLDATITTGWTGVVPLAELRDTHVAAGFDRAVVGGTMSEPTDFGTGRLDPVGFDAFLVGLSREGGVTWSRAFGGDGIDEVGDVALDASFVYAVGRYESDFQLGAASFDEAPGDSLFVVQLDGGGSPRWSRGIDAGVDGRSAVAVAPNGDVLVGATVRRAADFGGGVLSAGAGTDIVVARYDDTGAHVFSRRLNFGSEDELGLGERCR
ncbi:MAG: hypothetical protein AAF602_18160 [Myxococcota bacterium]